MPRPRVGISRCLLGDAVRYDGTHKRDDALAALGAHVEWVAVCPEVEVGMGTPREPIQLVRPSGARPGEPARLVGVRTAEEWTDRMAEWSRDRVEGLVALGLAGYVLKARSPSCGLYDAVIYTMDAAGIRPSGVGRGLFAQALVEALPDLPIEDETRLHTASSRERFLARVLAYQRATGRG